MSRFHESAIAQNLVDFAHNLKFEPLYWKYMHVYYYFEHVFFSSYVHLKCFFWQLFEQIYENIKSNWLQKLYFKISLLYMIFTCKIYTH